MVLQTGDVVELTIVSATKLMIADVMVQSSDPYVIVRSSLSSAFSQRTHIVKKNLNPKWNETFSFFIDKETPALDLELRVMDWDRFTKDVSAYSRQFSNQ